MIKRTPKKRSRVVSPRKSSYDDPYDDPYDDSQEDSQDDPYGESEDDLYGESEDDLYGDSQDYLQGESQDDFPIRISPRKRPSRNSSPRKRPTRNSSPRQTPRGISPIKTPRRASYDTPEDTSSEREPSDIPISLQNSRSGNTIISKEQGGENSATWVGSPNKIIV